MQNSQSLRQFEEHFPQIEQDVFVDSSSVVIGQVSLGQGSSIWPQVTIRGDINYIKIGYCTNIQDNSMLHVSHARADFAGAPLNIGNNVTVGHSCVLHGCTIEDYSLIGMGSIVLDCAHIEKHVLLGAGSLVAPHMRLESGYLYVGRPAKKVRALTQEELDYFTYSAQYYYDLSTRHKQSDH